MRSVCVPMPAHVSFQQTRCAFLNRNKKNKTTTTATAGLRWIHEINNNKWWWIDRLDEFGVRPLLPSNLRWIYSFFSLVFSWRAPNHRIELIRIKKATGQSFRWNGHVCNSCSLFFVCDRINSITIFVMQQLVADSDGCLPVSISKVNICNKSNLIDGLIPNES